MSDVPRSPSLRSPDRSPSLRQDAARRGHRVLDHAEEWLDAPLARSPGNCVGECSGGLESLDCAGLAREKQAVDDAREKAQLSEEMYKPRSERSLPAGYRHATNEELQALGLLNARTGKSLLDPKDHPDFKADVFRHDSGRYTIAFRGTTRAGEILPSVVQGGGFSTPYYTQAMQIGQNASRRMPGMVDFTGHSLGGGLASAAAFEGGSPATTFNTSRLHPNNIPRTVASPDVRNWYIRGEVLNGFERELRPLSPPVAGRQIALDPAPHSTSGGPLLDRLKGIGGRPARLHSIAEVRRSLDARQRTIRDLQGEKGCAA